MEKVVLKAVRRDVKGKQVKALRRVGQMPAVIYGHRIQPISILLDFRDTSKALTGLPPSALVTVEVEGETHQTLVREKQRNKISGSIIHVDFMAVSMEDKLRADINIDLVGISPAVKDFDGILVTNLNELEVECLPGDLPEKIVVDISNMKNIGDTIYVRDLSLSDKVKIVEDPDTVVVSVIAQAAEEVAVQEPGVAEPEVIEHGKMEEEI